MATFNNPEARSMNFSTSVARGKWGLLNSGHSDHYAILKPGAFSREFETMRINTTEWRTIIEVWQGYLDDGTTLTSLEGHVANIIARFDQYRKLADTTKAIQDANITGGSEVTEQWRNTGDGPSWLKQDLFLDWSEESNVTFTE